MSIKLPPCTLQHRPAMCFAGIKIAVTERAAEEIPALWQAFMAQNPLHYMQGDSEYGLCIQGVSGTEYMAAVPVLNTDAVPQQWDTITMPASSFAVFPHPEPVWRIRETIDAIFTPGALEFQHQPANRIAFLESYSPEFDPISGTGGISIWVPVVKTE